MQEGIFGDRERAVEANYFRQQDARLLESLRKNASLDDIALALRDKLHVDNPDLLAEARELGVTAETAPAFLVAPLVKLAWADGSATKAEKGAVMRFAKSRGIDEGSPAHAKLGEWLETRPSDRLFELSVDAIREGFAVLPHEEREQRIRMVLRACEDVAKASSPSVARILGLGSNISDQEAEILEWIEAGLRGSA